MEALAAEQPATPSRTRFGNSVVAGASVLSIAAFLWMRAGTKPPQQFQGMCERLHEAGLAIVPQDVFCHPMSWTARTAYVVASMLVAVGFVLTGVILAANGRRVTAFLPLLGALAVTYPQDVLFATRLWGSTRWPQGANLSTAVTMGVMALPIGAAIWAGRANRIRRPIPSLIPCVGATLVCGATVAACVLVAQDLLSRHWGGSRGSAGIDEIVPAAITIAIFGALLGLDRRWWPWSVAPIALLLSAGPSTALIVGPERILDWSNFGIVVPLFAAGLAGSAWGPLAARLARLFPDEDEAWPISSEPRVERAPVGSVRLRPLVVVNAAAAGVLVVSLIVFRADPSPVQSAMALPTYLGARISVQDLRTKLDLRLAMTTMDAYRQSHGTYAGFDATVGSAADPSISWIDGLPPQPLGTPEHTVVSIMSATQGRARVVAMSGSGNGFCLERMGDDLSYGRGIRLAAPGPGVNVIEEAMGECGSTLWSRDAIRRFPIETMCDGVEAGRYLICRAVQALMTTTLQRL